MHSSRQNGVRHLLLASARTRNYREVEKHANYAIRKGFLMRIVALSLATICAAYSSSAVNATDQPSLAGSAPASAAFGRAPIVSAGVPNVIKARRIAGVGIAVIRDYKVIWTHYYGEQGPGVPASRTTMFNTASVAKSITTEATLRLVAQGKVSLEEPIAGYYIEPDLDNDPRYKKLTPRLILTHQTGLLNWPYNYKDKKLAFVVDPGTKFGYSGAGFDILAHFLEKKLNTDFESLVNKLVFAPIGMSDISMRRRQSIDARVTTPMNSDGVYEAPYTTSQPDHHRGSWSSAADLFVTVDDYAKFFISVMKGQEMSPALKTDRWRVQSSFVGAPEWECLPEATITCPNPYGFGLGWLVFDYGTSKFVWAGGNDSGENALAYFDPTKPGDGVIVFINGGNGVIAMPDIIDLIDPSQKWSEYIRQLINRHFSK
jgi:CubicO group peptidase (beta-lactamase class C family)